VADLTSGQDLGFNKRVTIQLEGRREGITADVTEALACARALLAAAHNGWVDAGGQLDMEGPMGDLLFPRAPRRKAGYIVARWVRGGGWLVGHRALVVG
jgi:hypothetical protein